MEGGYGLNPSPMAVQPFTLPYPKRKIKNDYKRLQ
jgi:hypothetical protein